MFKPDNYDDFIHWLRNYNVGKQVLDATGLDNFENESFLAKLNYEQTGFIFLSLDSTGLTQGEIIMDDKSDNCVVLKRINIKEVVNVECSLSEYTETYHGHQFNQIQYSVFLRDGNRLELRSTDYVTKYERNSYQKFMELGRRLLNKFR
ncbi:hypothetical protein CA600_12695 [Paenibacillus sp. VTT E-133280]|uniref:hypothetical protein n=1 Tax=Paenibacillus sp. VTT E-133280 TaxID=1986222 RepID=UPI000BA058A6|nr:hypothetical protein [Paenibacillus sp. VTT E-133280]OZQ66110.1 hypothetical protein CA600_12695 [Paenibacillus sp. VTT E-133280]